MLKRLYSITLLVILLLFFHHPVFAYSQQVRVLLDSEKEYVSILSEDRIKVFNYQNRKFIRIFSNDTPVECRPSPLGIDINGYDIHTDLILLSGYNQSPLQVGNRQYRGEIIIHKDIHYHLEIINKIEVELYLQGIMKQEISPEWPKACLMAQAIAARSYALFEKQRATSLYDLKSSVESQIYLGLDGEDPLTNQAIKDTAGMILTVEGTPLLSFYHACCGGHTESAQDIFGDYPFLPGTTCKFCQESPYYQWEVKFSDIQIRNYLLRSDMKVGPIKFFRRSGLTDSGRTRVLKITHTLGSDKVPAKNFRKMVGYNQLPSLLFRISEVKEDKNNKKSSHGKIFLFSGRGWGHGVGLCQWGAKKMAEEGATYNEILQKYYPLAELSTLR